MRVRIAPHQLFTPVDLTPTYRDSSEGAHGAISSVPTLHFMDEHLRRSAPPAIPPETVHRPASPHPTMSDHSVIDRLPSLPERPRCPECNTRMQADIVFHPTAFEHIHAWVCPADCDHREVREDDHF